MTVEAPGTNDAPDETTASTPVMTADEELGSTTRTFATTVSSLSAIGPTPAVAAAADVAPSCAVGTTSTTTIPTKHHGVPNGGGSGGKDLIWSGVTMTLLEGKTGDVKLNILKDVWGKAQAGKTTAIMGASGAGSEYTISG